MNFPQEKPVSTSTINIASNSENPTEALLSNLAHTPFILDWKEYTSVEGFWQWLKFSKEEDRIRIASMYGILSKKIGNEGDNKNGTFEYLWKIYTAGSSEHQELMCHAIRAKLKQNPEVLKLLFATGSAPIIHEPKKKDGTPYPDSETIPAVIFSGFLMRLRSDLSVSEKIQVTKQAASDALVIGEPNVNVAKALPEKLLWVLSNQEEQFSELAEKIWDLFYDALAEVLVGISETAMDIATYMKQAWEHTQNAWEICKPFINKRTNPKHTVNVGGMNNATLGQSIGKLDKQSLKQFLKLLWDKIYKDGLADEWRWRKKLATELFETSKSILWAQASISE